MGRKSLRDDIQPGMTIHAIPAEDWNTVASFVKNFGTVGQILEDLSGGRVKLKVTVDNESIELSTVHEEIQIKADGVTKEHINPDVAGNGLGQAEDGAIFLRITGTSLEIIGDNLRVVDNGISPVQCDGQYGDVDIPGVGILHFEGGLYYGRT